VGRRRRRGKKDYATDEILIIQDAENCVNPSDSCLSERYKKEIHQMKWSYQKCGIPLHPGMSEVK